MENKRIEELLKQKAEIEKEIKRLKGTEYKSGRVKVAMRGQYITRKWGLTISPIIETDPQDKRRVGVIYCTELENMPKYIDCLIQDLKDMKVCIENGGMN